MDPLARIINGAQSVGRQGIRKQFGRSLIAARQSHLEFSWGATIVSSDEFVKRYLRKLVARSREATVNYEHLQKYHRTIQANVVGPSGIQAIPKFVDDGPDKAPDKLANQAVKEAWEEWCERGNCEVTGRLSFTGVQGVYMKTVPEDGEFLARLVYDRSSRFGLRLQLLDTQLLPVDMNVAEHTNGNRIVMGIELNPWGRPVAYHIRQEKPTDTSWNHAGGHYERIPAEFIIHEFLTERVGQKRGLPWASSALARIRMLYGLDEAVQTKTRIGASTTAVVTAPEGKWKGAGEEDEDGWVNREIIPGEYLVLPHGAELTKWDPESPKGELPLFRKAMIQTIAAGLVMSYPTISGDLEGVNFSSIRHGAIEERRVYQCLREGLLIQGLVQRVYRAWLRAALLLEAITIPTKNGGSAPLSLERERKYWNVRYQGAGWEYVRPLEDAAAWEKMVMTFQASPQEAIRARGGNPDVVLEEWGEFLGRMQELGIDYFGANRGADNLLVAALLGGESEEKEPAR